MNPNKLLFHMFLGMAMNCFKDFYEQEEESLRIAIRDHMKSAEENKTSLKVALKEKEQMEQDLNAMTKMHARIKEVNNFVLKKHRQTMGPATIDHMHVTSVFINEMINKVKKPKDFAKIITIVEMFNEGKFDEAFAAVEEKPSIELLTQSNEDLSIKELLEKTPNPELEKQIEDEVKNELAENADNSKGD